MNEKYKLYFVVCDNKLCKVNLLNGIVCKKSSFKGDIKQKQKNCYFVTPVGSIRGGSGGKPDWLYRLSTYGIYSKAVEAIIKEI